MTPHDLINLKGYGSARKEVISMGKWKNISALEVLNNISEDDCTVKVNALIDEAISLLENLEDNE